MYFRVKNNEYQAVLLQHYCYVYPENEGYVARERSDMWQETL